MRSVPPCWRIKHTDPAGQQNEQSEDITEDELDASGARIFKINVSDTDSTGWGDCVRIYELELYAYKEAAKSELLTGKAQVLGVTVRIPGSMRRVCPKGGVHHEGQWHGDWGSPPPSQAHHAR